MKHSRRDNLKAVPFFRPKVGTKEFDEVIAVLRSGWITTGPRVGRFERGFAKATGADYAVALNSCTAALHLGSAALGLERGQAVLVPTMTFAATAEVVLYQGAVPVLVDCDEVTLNLDLVDAAAKLEGLREGRVPVHNGSELHGGNLRYQWPRARREGTGARRHEGALGGAGDMRAGDAHVTPIGVMPVHVGGLMCDVDAVADFAEAHGLWVVEDAAHAFPAAWRQSPRHPWQRCGQNTAAVSCFSFYANKTITTGEGGMAVTDDEQLAERIRLLSLHGLSKDAWQRYSGNGSWDYQIVEPGYKYNMTDIAAAIGIHQLARAEEMRLKREALAHRYLEAFGPIEEIELPPDPPDRIHAWHLFAIKLNLDRLAIDRNMFLNELKAAGVGFSVHWRPLHLHPYYRDVWRWRPEHCPVATRVWERLVSLPIFPGMTDEEHTYVVKVVRELCARYARPATGTKHPQISQMDS